MPKVGYVAIVGRPNAGKSTLLNAIIGERVSAISSRPQTTQRSIPGIFTDMDKGVQIIFLDTPGIHNHSGEQYGSPKTHDINERINSQAFASLREADVILRLVDPTRPYGEEDARIDDILSTLDTPVIRVETKQDLPKGYPGKDVDIAVDSMSKNGFDALIEKISTLLPEGPYLYEEDFYTDQPMYFRIAEVIREVLFSELGEEIPYASYVEVGEVEEREPIPYKSPPSKGGRGVLSPFAHSTRAIPYDRTLITTAKENRKSDNPVENKFWYDILSSATLKDNKFTRQKPLLSYIVDFYCSELGLVIELDGDSHIDQKEYDEKRTKDLAKYDLTVIRFSNRDVMMNPDGVLDQLVTVIRNLKSREGSTPLGPPLEGGHEQPSSHLPASVSNKHEGVAQLQPLLKIQAYINVESDSQKTILIGKGGQKIQDIGTKSRLILEEVFGKKVFLALRVKVDKNWRKNEKVLDKLFPKR